MIPAQSLISVFTIEFNPQSNDKFIVDILSDTTNQMQLRHRAAKYTHFTDYVFNFHIIIFIFLEVCTTLTGNSK